MKAERWQRVKELLNEALERDPAQRTAFLNEHCAGDVELRHEVDSLLASFEQADDDFMEASPMGAVAARAREPKTDLGERIGPYRLIEEVGRGGMGTVYRAWHVDDPTRGQVALKIVKRGMDQDFILHRFRNERKILAALDHPNIAKLLDVGATDDGLPYFVMEFVEGARNIIEYCDQERLGTPDRLRMFLAVCSAVQAAHDRRIVHRDIKPGNILIDQSGNPKLLDFGIAKILDPDLTSQTIDVTATILRLMTPEYASPEQVRGDEITACSDVYSLGVLLYELLTGHRPYRLKSRSPHEIAQVICEESPERPSTMIGRTELVTRPDGAVTLTPEIVGKARATKPDELRRVLCGELDNIILMAMRKEPERRYASAGALAEDILRYLDGLSVFAKPDTLMYRTRRMVRRNRTAVLVTTAAVFAASALTVGWQGYVQPLFSKPDPPPKTIPLTSFPGDETQPAFSPDGSRMAFVWEGESSDNSDIYIKPVRGVGLERVTTNQADDVSPTWSPDGSRIAWLRATPNETAVYVSKAQPSEVHQKITSLYPNRIEAVGRHLDWSPAGNYLAAADKLTDDEPFRIVLIELSTGHKMQLTNPPAGTIGDSSPAFSPDGRYVAFIRGLSSGVDDIFIRATDGSGEARRITNDKRYIISLAWEPDGKSIMFSSNRAGNHSMWRVSSSGGAPEPAGVVGENVSDPVFSRDGRYMAFSQFYMDSNIWSMDLQTASRHKVISSTQYDSSPAFSPDGTKIAFRSTRSGTDEIWVASRDGTDEYQLTRFGNSVTGSPKWSPDGQRIAFDSRPEGQPEIYVVDADGANLHRITYDPGEDVVPNWSRDGKWIYFGSNRTGSFQIWKVPAGGGTALQVTHGGGFAAKESPDGKWVYYARGRSIAGLWRVHPDASGEEAVWVDLKPGLWAYFAQTRQGIYFVDRDSAHGAWVLYLLPNGRKEPVRTAFFDKPVPTGDGGMAASPDGQSVLYAQIDQSGSDILIIENPRPK